MKNNMAKSRMKIMNNVICTLPSDVNSCPYYNKGKCEDNKSSCSFKKDSGEDKTYRPYERGERWYEKYYKRRKDERSNSYEKY